MTVDISDPATPKIASITDQERESLTLRPAKPTDYDQLYQYRVQCGWGEERLKTYWQDPDRPLCILQISINGEERDIGMGGWILDVSEDQVIASRKTNTVELTSLYITSQYQGLGLGGAAISLLEKGAITLHGAKTITLDTMAYELEEEEGRPVINYSKPSRNCEWYTRRGYVPIDPPHLFYSWPQPDGTEFKIPLIQMRKAAPTVL